MWLVMNPTLQHLKFIGKMGNQLGQLKYPSGLCIQPFTRHLLVCDAANHRIQVVSLDEEKNDEEKNDEDNEEEKCQSLFVIGRADGKPGEAKGEFNHPSGISCGMDGSMVVADSKNHRVQIFDASGRFLSAFGSKRERPAELNWPHDVCFLFPPFSPSSSSPSSSLLLVADSSNQRLSIWSVPSSSSLSSSIQRHQPLDQIPVANQARGVCVDLQGYVYVSCGGWNGGHRVEVREPRMNWHLVEILGSCDNSGDNSGEKSYCYYDSGRFHTPIGMCVDDVNTLMFCFSLT